MPETSVRGTHSSDTQAVIPQGQATKRPRTDDQGSDVLAAVDISASACHHCHARKVKCGGELPRCAGCVRANAPCMVHDPSAPRPYTREEFQQLYNRAKDLERDLEVAAGQRLGPGNPKLGRLGENERHATRPTTRDGSTTGRRRTASGQGNRGTAPTENRFVGQDTAVNFFLARLRPPRGQGASTAQSERPDLRVSRMRYHAPHPFPSRDVASMVVRDYFQHQHPAQPILSPGLIYDTLDRTLNTAIPSTTIKATDLFRLFMALAIGSIRLYRSGSFELHPFGYFTAALEVWTPSMSSFNTLEDIEHFLLIAQFGFFYDIGCSLWELGRLSMRTAVELGLHCAPSSMLASDAASSTDRFRRVFWMAYMLDRSSSYTLGRPFAIHDEAITTPLPDATFSRNAHHNCRINLSRLTSQMRCSLRPKSGSVTHEPAPSSQQALQTASLEFSTTIALLRKFNSQLQEWRSKAPIQDKPTCLIESLQYYDLLYQEARLGLLRAAIDKLALSPTSLPNSLLRPSFSAACSIISIFDHLRQSGLSTCTRAEAHLAFVTSLVILSLIHASDGLCRGASVDAQLDVNEDPWLDFLDDGLFHLTAESASDAISMASQLLSWLCEALPDFAICARIFEDTKRSLGLERLADPRVGRRVDVGIQAEDGQLKDGNQGDYDGSSGQSWITADTTVFQNPALFDGSIQEMVGAAPSFDLTTAASMTEGFAMPSVLGVNTLSWPLSEFEGMAAIDACFSGYIWDMNVPWQGSPSVTMNSV